MAKKKPIPDGIDAVFLPGKIHGAEHQAYIVYYSAESCDGDGSWEIEVVDKERVLALHAAAQGNATAFFASLPGWFHGEWSYCTRENKEYEKAFWRADFISGRDGGIQEEMTFLVNWARGGSEMSV